jgi:hypothetical protein
MHHATTRRENKRNIPNNTSERKLHASIHAACLSVREFTGSAEVTATTVCDHFESWLEKKV